MPKARASSRSPKRFARHGPHLVCHLEASRERSTPSWSCAPFLSEPPAKPFAVLPSYGGQDGRPPRAKTSRRGLPILTGPAYLSFAPPELCLRKKNPASPLGGAGRNQPMECRLESDFCHLSVDVFNNKFVLAARGGVHGVPAFPRRIRIDGGPFTVFGFRMNFITGDAVFIGVGPA